MKRFLLALALSFLFTVDVTAQRPYNYRPQPARVHPGDMLQMYRQYQYMQVQQQYLYAMQMQWYQQQLQWQQYQQYQQWLYLQQWQQPAQQPSYPDESYPKE